MDHQEIPLLINFLYGSKVPMGRDEVSERLLRWCQAFDDWLAARQRDCHPLTFKNSRFAWQQLLSQVGKPPWKISPADMCSYVEWLQDKGRAPGTIRQHLGTISSFYSWCSERGVDRQCEPGCDPVKGVKRPKVRRYANAQVLNREEACALLAVLKLDDYILTKRDYAFFLARLRMGVPVKELLALQSRATSSSEMAALISAQSLLATRLAEMLKAEKERQAQRPEESWAEQFLARLADSAKERGEEFDIDKEREALLAGDVEAQAAAWRLMEEIAATRLGLRRAFHLAMESEEVQERVHLTNIYGQGCSRLVKLLKAEGLEHTRLEVAMNDLIDQVILEINEEWGLK